MRAALFWVFFAWTAFAVPATAWAAGIQAPDLGLLKEQSRIKADSELKIQRDILDPILGKDKATVSVDVVMEVKVEREEAQRKGMGLAERYKEKMGAKQGMGADTLYVLPGVPKPKTISQGLNTDKPESLLARQSEQTKGVEEESYRQTPIFKRLHVTVFHDDTVLKTEPEKEVVRERIIESMGSDQKGEPFLSRDDVLFRLLPYVKQAVANAVEKFKKDLNNPWVWLPLLYALLLMLLLLFLFGPLAKFFRQYVAALREKPGAEVNIESKMEAPDEKGNEEEGLNEGALDVTLQRKPSESVEDESMKKFEPFSYINEENIKRLVYMFLLRKEEPWVIAVVASYLRPEFARALLTALPADLQAKVALEALTVRSLTKEQVQAIDVEIKEKVDFVVGGIERLVAMLDDADSATRNNILNYLKNDKPSLYEKVRKHIMIFDDIVGFPDRDVQTIVRELKPDNMAKALQNAPPELVNKFFSNMSAGAGALLREAMEYITDLTEDKIEEERSKIIETVKVLDKKGTISVRAKVDESMGFEALQEDLSSRDRRDRGGPSAKSGAGPGAGAAAAPAPAADPAEAQKYFQAGVSYHDAGQLEAAVQYLEYALTMDPSLWQAHQYLGGIFYQLGRTTDALTHYERLLELNPDPQIQQWVESFKSQVGK